VGGWSQQDLTSSAEHAVLVVKKILTENCGVKLVRKITWKNDEEIGE
jgi:hypothetical protein